jgi:hypothetical protein
VGPVDGGEWRLTLPVGSRVSIPLMLVIALGITLGAVTCNTKRIFMHAAV